MYRHAKHVHKPIWFKLNQNYEVGTAYEIKRASIHTEYQKILNYYYQRIKNIEHVLNSVALKAFVDNSDQEKTRIKILMKGESAIKLTHINNKPVSHFKIQPKIIYPKVTLSPYTIWHSKYKADFKEQSYILDVQKNLQIKSLRFENLVTGKVFDLETEHKILTKEKDAEHLNNSNLENKHKKVVYLGPGKVVLDKTLVLSPNQTLVIHPGTQIYMKHNVGLVVKGDFKAVGTKDLPILITSERKGKAFASIVVQSAQNVHVEHTSIQGGSGLSFEGVNYTGMLSLYNVDKAILKHVNIHSNQTYDDMVNFKYVKNFVIDHSFFSNAFADALDLDYSHGTIRSSQFLNSGNDGVDMMSSQVSLQHCYFERNQDKAVSVGEASIAQLESNHFQNLDLALAVKDLSIVENKNSKLQQVKKFAKIYQKSSYYYMAGILIDNQSLPNNVEVGSSGYLLDSIDSLVLPSGPELKVPMLKQIKAFKQFKKSRVL